MLCLTKLMQSMWTYCNSKNHLQKLDPIISPIACKPLRFKYHPTTAWKVCMKTTEDGGIHRRCLWKVQTVSRLICASSTYPQSKSVHSVTISIIIKRSDGDRDDTPAAGFADWRMSCGLGGFNKLARRANFRRSQYVYLYHSIIEVWDEEAK